MGPHHKTILACANIMKLGAWMDESTIKLWVGGPPQELDNFKDNEGNILGNRSSPLIHKN